MTKEATDSRPQDPRSPGVAWGPIRFGAGMLLLASWMLPVRGMFGLDLCLFHRWTGWPCPGCGLTRAICAIGHGCWRQAWALHPMAFPIYGLALLLLLAPLAARLGAGAKRAERWLGHLVLAAMGALLAFGLWRLAGFYPWP